jgi:hypothetical protein
MSLTVIPATSTIITATGHGFLGSVAKFGSEVDRVETVPISATNPFKGRQYPGEVILQAVRWYLRYPLAYEHVAELLAERGLEVDASCVWRWVQAYSPELNKRCGPHLKHTNKSYRVDETYSALSSVLLRRVEVPLVLG